jgi:hypothetical protein
MGGRLLDRVGGGDWASSDDGGWLLDGISGGDWGSGDDLLMGWDRPGGDGWLLVGDLDGELVNLLLSGVGGVHDWRVGLHSGNGVSVPVWSGIGGHNLVGDWDGGVLDSNS